MKTSSSYSKPHLERTCLRRVVAVADQAKLNLILSQAENARQHQGVRSLSAELALAPCFCEIFATMDWILSSSDQQTFAANPLALQP